MGDAQVGQGRLLGPPGVREHPAGFESNIHFTADSANPEYIAFSEPVPEVILPFAVKLKVIAELGCRARERGSRG